MSWRRPAHSGHVLLRCTACDRCRDRTGAGRTAAGIGRPYAYALSYGGAEPLSHFLHSFLAELDVCMAICTRHRNGHD